MPPPALLGDREVEADRRPSQPGAVLLAGRETGRVGTADEQLRAKAFACGGIDQAGGCA